MSASTMPDEFYWSAKMEHNLFYSFDYTPYLTDTVVLCAKALLECYHSTCSSDRGSMVAEELEIPRRMLWDALQDAGLDDMSVLTWMNGWSTSMASSIIRAKEIRDGDYVDPKSVTRKRRAKRK